MAYSLRNSLSMLVAAGGVQRRARCGRRADSTETDTETDTETGCSRTGPQSRYLSIQFGLSFRPTAVLVIWLLW